MQANKAFQNAIEYLCAYGIALQDISDTRCEDKCLAIYCTEHAGFPRIWTWVLLQLNGDLSLCFELFQLWRIANIFFFQRNIFLERYNFQYSWNLNRVGIFLHFFLLRITTVFKWIPLKYFFLSRIFSPNAPVITITTLQLHHSTQKVSMNVPQFEIFLSVAWIGKVCS